MKKPKRPKPRNPIAKNLRVNRPNVMVDKRKAAKCRRAVEEEL